MSDNPTNSEIEGGGMSLNSDGSAEKDAVDNVRLLVQKADHERKYASAAEDAMRSIRLGYSPKIRERKRLWFGIRERAFTTFETRVLYEALELVKRAHEDRASAYEGQMLSVTSPGQERSND